MAQLVAALSTKFGMPPEFVKSMIQQKMMGDAAAQDSADMEGEVGAGLAASDGGETDGDVQRGEGSLGGRSTGLAAGFAALKRAAGKAESAEQESSSTRPERVEVSNTRNGTKENADLECD
jgi:hypothetical protein